MTAVSHPREDRGMAVVSPTDVSFDRPNVLP
jgi:hypothetical protein